MIGKLVKETRQRKRLTQVELAKHAGLSQNYISKLETGEIELPQRGTLLSLGKPLGLTLADFYRAAGVIDAEPSQHVAEVPATFDADAVRLAEIGRQVVDLVKREAPSFVIPSGQIELVPDPPAEPMIEVPVYDRFAASYLGSSGGQAGDRMSVPQRLWKRAQEPRLIYVSGPCLAMRGILSGDYLVVDAANRDPRDGEVVAFRFRGEEAVKVCFRFDDRIEFRPTIETFPTITVRLGEEEDLEIVGVSVGLVQCAERG